MNRPCMACREAEATGILFDLCEPCFRIFEARVEAAASASGSYRMPDDELVIFSDEAFRIGIVKRSD